MILILCGCDHQPEYSAEVLTPLTSVKLISEGTLDTQALIALNAQSLLVFSNEQLLRSQQEENKREQLNNQYYLFLIFFLLSFVVIILVLGTYLLRVGVLCPKN